MTMASARVAYVNIFARDKDALATFYAKLFGFREMEAHRSPIYACLDANGVEMGFNGPEAYALLGLADRQGGSRSPVCAYFTIEVDTVEAVDTLAANATDMGGRIVKPPYDTYYNARQAVIEDPEGNIFRINHRKGARLHWQEVERAGALPFQVPSP